MNRLESLKDNLIKNRILVENFSFLSALQVSNLILFLVTVPYLFRILGSQNYGLIVFAQTIAFYFTILINFGFNLTATRDISVNRDISEKVSEIISSVLTIRVILFLLSFALMILAVLSITELKNHWQLFVFSMIACLSDALFPLWYFQGIEKMKYITFINVIARIAATVLVFILINSASKYYFYPLIMGSGAFAGAIAALVIVFVKHNNRFVFQPFKTIIRYLNENILYLFSNVSTQIYLNANKIVAGLFLGMTDVAYYDVAEKVVNILKVPYSLLGQTLFPRMSKERNTDFLKKIMLYTFAITVLIIISVAGLAGPIINFLSGNENSISVTLLQILSISILPICVGLFYGDIILINFGLREDYVRIRLAGLIFYLVLFLIGYVTGGINLIYLSVLIVSVEILTAAYSYLVFRKKVYTELKAKSVFQ